MYRFKNEYRLFTIVLYNYGYYNNDFRILHTWKRKFVNMLPNTGSRQSTNEDEAHIIHYTLYIICFVSSLALDSAFFSSLSHMTIYS